MKWLIGIDEAGRGALAGPVAVGVFAIRKDQQKRIKVLKKAKDSKVLSEKERELLFAEIQNEKLLSTCSFEVAHSTPQYIDKHGIVPAIKNAMKKALAKLQKQGIYPEICEVLLDGSLKAPDEFKNQKTIIKGDAKIPVISAASICAKVVRDRYMMKMSKKYVKYDFHVHKGYGTKKHLKMIRELGMCDIHRESFLTRIVSPGRGVA